MFWPWADDGSVEITEQMNRRKGSKERQQRQQMIRENIQGNRQGDSIINDGRGDASSLVWLNISLGLVCAFVC